MLFRDRAEAGRFLAGKLKHYRGQHDVLVLALPRGGVPVAFEVATSLAAPLDIFLVRKLGVPGHSELAMGAIASGGIRVLNEDIIQALQIPEETIAATAAQEQRELERRELMYRQGKASEKVQHRIIILIDDGLATGATMRAASVAIRSEKAKRLIVAVPVAAGITCGQLEAEVDELICATTPEPFYGVGQWYADFSQTTDEEVIGLLRQADKQHKSAKSGAAVHAH